MLALAITLIRHQTQATESKTGIVVHTCNSVTQEAEAGELLWAETQPGQPTEFETSQKAMKWETLPPNTDIRQTGSNTQQPETVS